MAQTRFYSSTSGSMTLVGSINASATSLIVNTTTGLPASVPFTIIVDPGLASMEIMDVTAVGGTTLTVTRGRDGTSGQSHDNGAVVRHGFSARDFDESRAHEDDLTAHGATGAVVGTTNTQALTNKDLTSGTNTFPTALATLTGTQTLTNKTMSGASNTFTNIPNSAVTALAALAGNAVGVNDSQTLTNKTISGASNTLSNIAQSSVTSLTTDLAALDTRLDTIEGRNRCRIEANANQNIPHNTVTRKGFEVAAYDTNSMADVANDRITVATTGYYQITSQVAFDSNSTGIRVHLIRVNGNTIAHDYRNAVSGSITASLINTGTIALTAGDDIDIHVLQTSGGILAMTNPNGVWSWLTVEQTDE